MRNPQPKQIYEDQAKYVRKNIWGHIKEYGRTVRLFSRNARLYLLGSFLLSINFAVFNLLYNLYLREYGFAEGDIGQWLSARAVGMTIMAIPAAIVLSRIRLKPFLLASCMLFAVFTFGLTQIVDLYLLVFVAGLTGMAFSIYRVASGPFYMRNSTPAERTHLFSFSFAMMILANMAGSAGSGELVTWLESLTGDIILAYRYTLYLGIAVGLTALIPFSLIKAAPPSAEENRISLSVEQLKRRWPFYSKLTFANFLIGSGAGLMVPFLNLYFRDRFGLSPDVIGHYFFLVACSMFVGTLSGPLFTKRLGLVRTIVVTQLLSIPFMLILAHSFVLPLVVVAFVMRAGLMNLGVPINTNFGMELSEKSEQGLVNALLMISWTGSWMVSAAVGGFAIEHYGYSVVITVSAAMYVMSAILYYWFFHGVEEKRDDRPGWIIPADTRI